MENLRGHRSGAFFSGSSAQRRLGDAFCSIVHGDGVSLQRRGQTCAARVILQIKRVFVPFVVTHVNESATK